MVGDAFAFSRPGVFLPVYLAMSGAEQPPGWSIPALREPRLETRLLRKLEKRQRPVWRALRFYLSIQQPGHGEYLRQPPQSVADRAGCHLHSWPVICSIAQVCAAAARVLACVRMTDCATSGVAAEHRYRKRQARLQFTGGTTPRTPVTPIADLKAAAATPGPEASRQVGDPRACVLAPREQAEYGLA